METIRTDNGGTIRESRTFWAVNSHGQPVFSANVVSDDGAWYVMDGDSRQVIASVSTAEEACDLAKRECRKYL